MAGSALAGRLLAPSLNIRVERYMQAVFAVSALALFVPVIFNRTKAVDEADSLKADAPGEHCHCQHACLDSTSCCQGRARKSKHKAWHQRQLELQVL